MSNCDISQILSDARCFECLSPKQRDAAMAGLLCGISETLSGEINVNIANQLAASRDTNNEQTIPLAAGGVFTGTFTKIDIYPHFQLLYAATTPITSVKIIWSHDGITPLGGAFGSTTVPQRVISGYNVAYHVGQNNNSAPYYRLEVTNGATPQGAFPSFISIAWLAINAYNGSFVFLNDSLTNLSKALLTRSVLAGSKPDGTFSNASLDTDSDLQVSQRQIGDSGNSLFITDATVFPTRTVTDASITRGSNILTSATAAFTSIDVGGRLIGDGLLGESYIRVVVDPSTVVMVTRARETLSGVTLEIAQPIDGTPFSTRSRNIQENLVVVAGLNAYGNNPDIGGCFTFRYHPDSGGVAGTPTIIEVNQIHTFKEVRNFGWLSNAGDYFSVLFVPSRVMIPGEFIVVSTNHSKIAGNDFKRLPLQELEEQNQTLSTIQSFVKAFGPTGRSVGILATEESELRVRNAGTITPSGAQHSEGTRDDITHDFGTDSDTVTGGAANVSALIDLGSINGTKTHDPVNGGAVFATGAAVGSLSAWRSQHVVNYSRDTGHGVLGEQTVFIETPSTWVGNAHIEWGYGSLTDGFGYGHHAIDGYYTWLKKGGVYLYQVYQDDWNEDKCIGENFSRFRRAGIPEVLDIFMDNLYRYEGEFLYAAEQTFKVKVPKGPLISTNVHEYPNSATQTSLKTANLPLFIAIYNDSTLGGVVSVRCGSWRGGIFTNKTPLTGKLPDGTYGDVGLTSEGDLRVGSKGIISTLNSVASVVLAAATAPVVFTVDVTANTIESVGHGLSVGNALTFTSTSALPTPIQVGLIYWIVATTADDFQVATVPLYPAIDITTSGTGTSSYSVLDFYEGSYEPVIDYKTIRAVISASGLTSGWGSFSENGTTEHHAIGPVPIAGGGAFAAAPEGAYFKARIVNVSSIPVTLQLSTTYHYQPQQHFQMPIAAGVIATMPANLVKAQIVGKQPNGVYTDVRTQGPADSTSSTLTLEANETFRGEWQEWESNFVEMMVAVQSDQSGGLFLDYSNRISPVNGVDTDVTLSIGPLPYSPVASPLLRGSNPLQSRWVRLRYVNGVAAQSEFNLRAVFLTSSLGSGIKPAAFVLQKDLPTTMQDSITSSRTQESTDGSEVYVQDRSTLNSSTGKRGKNSNITGVDVAIDIKALPDVTDTGRFTASVTSPVQLPAPTVLNPKTVQIINLHPDNTVSIGTLVKLAASQGHALLPQLPLELDYDGQTNRPYFQVDSGSVPLSATTDRFGTGTANVVGATNPANINANDGVFTTFAASSDSLDITGLTAALTYPTIASVKVAVKAAKGTNQTTEQVTFVSSQVGNAGAVGSVVSASVTGGSDLLVLAFVAREVSSATNGGVSGLTGMGLTWVQVGSTQNSDDDHRRIDLWRAYGTATTGSVTATFSTTPTSSRIAVHTISGADSTTPVQATGGTADNNATVTGPAIAGTNRGLSVLGAAINNATSTAGAGYTERTDDGGTTGTSNNLTTETKQLTLTGSETGTFTLSASKHYACIAATITPAAAINPVIRVRTKVGGIISGTSALFTLSSTTQGEITVVDITSDRSWTSTVLADTDLVVDSPTIGAATGIVDSARLTVTETESAATAPISYMYIGGGPTA